MPGGRAAPFLLRINRANRLLLLDFCSLVSTWPTGTPDEAPMEKLVLDASPLLVRSEGFPEKLLLAGCPSLRDLSA